MAQATTATPQQLAAAKKAVISSSIGAALEWFDIIVYATFAVVIAENFFPESDGTFGLLLTFATFAISYVIRPLGGMVLGSYRGPQGPQECPDADPDADDGRHADHGGCANLCPGRGLGCGDHPGFPSGPGLLRRR